VHANRAAENHAGRDERQQPVHTGAESLDDLESRQPLEERRHIVPKFEGEDEQIDIRSRL
jgi:hypothetical protein